MHVNAQLMHPGNGVAGMLVVTQGGDEQGLAGQAGELHGRDRSASGGLVKLIGRVHHIARGWDIPDARELDPLDMAHHRHPRPACLHGGSLTQSAALTVWVRPRLESGTWPATSRGTRLAEVPVQALALALAASIYPPAVAAIIALGRGSQVRSRVAIFVLAALIITYALGTVMLFVLVELGATGSIHRTPSGAVDVALGILLLVLAGYLYRKRPKTPKPSGDSRIDRHLRSRRLAFVLGLTLYALPSPIYVGAVKEVADAKLSTSGQLAALAVIVAVMLWMIELPMLMLLAVPDRASSVLERINRWFARRGRLLAVILSAAAGIFLIVEGTGDLIA